MGPGPTVATTEQPPMVLACLRAGFRGNYDAFFYRDRLVLRRVDGVDHERVGALIGFVIALGWLGAVIGAWIGRRVAAGHDAERIRPLVWLSPEQVAAG